jgi:hypothetical protein
MKQQFCSQLTKPTMLQASTWSHGFGRVNSIPGVRVHEGWDD